MAPAEALVSCDNPELADLPAQLLGRTLIVRDLATARAIAAHTTGFRLVTLQGELLEPDERSRVVATLVEQLKRAQRLGRLGRRSPMPELVMAGLGAATAQWFLSSAPPGLGAGIEALIRRSPSLRLIQSAVPSPEAADEERRVFQALDRLPDPLVAVFAHPNRRAVAKGAGLIHGIARL